MKRYFIFILCIIAFVGLSAVLMSSSDIDKLSDENTIEYSASVIEVNILENVKDVSIRIYVDEFFNYLLLSPRIASNIDLRIIENIKKNDKIFFRIERKKSNHINNSEFIDIVYLATIDNVIVSLDDYNNYTRVSATDMRIASITSLVLLTVFMFFFYIHTKNRTVKKHKKV